MLDKELIEQIKERVFLGVALSITPKGYAFIGPAHPTEKDFDSLIKRIKEMESEEVEFITLEIAYTKPSLVIGLLELLSRQ